MYIHFNFIMILFYCKFNPRKALSEQIFQFHYDLILLLYTNNTLTITYTFQFHYDLILFYYI